MPSLNIVNTSVIILENSTGTGLHKISAAHGTMARLGNWQQQNGDN